MLAKQPKDYHRGGLDEDDNESLVALENPTSICQIHLWSIREIMMIKKTFF